MALGSASEPKQGKPEALANVSSLLCVERRVGRVLEVAFSGVGKIPAVGLQLSQQRHHF